MPDQNGYDVFGDGGRYRVGESVYCVAYFYGNGDVVEAEDLFVHEGFKEGGGLGDVGYEEEATPWSKRHCHG